MEQRPNASPDRRQNVVLRSVFDEAYDLCLPYIDPAQGIHGRPLIHHASIVLRENFPELTSQDVMILVHTLQSTFRIRQTAARQQPTTAA